MFTSRGPGLTELAVQALSSVEHGYDLLAPKFDHTPFRTPAPVLDAVTRGIRRLGPFGRGLDLCCGTGAGTDVLRQVCRDRVTGVDISAGMLAVARAGDDELPAPPRTDRVRADARALPFRGVFDLVVSFGAFGHFLPAERPGLFAQVHTALGPGGRFVFPMAAPPRVGSLNYWGLYAFDAAMRVRNALWRPPFVMYYRSFPLSRVRGELARTGFTVELQPLAELGRRDDGSPRCALLVATKTPGPSA